VKGSKLKILGALAIVAILVVSIAIAGTIDATRVKRNTAYKPVSSNPATSSGDRQDYQARLVVYIAEPVSRYLNEDNVPFHNGVIGFALDTSFTLGSGESFNDTVIWDGAAAGFGDISSDNIMALVALSDMSQSYARSSDTGTGTGAPYDAYFVDASAAATVGEQWFNTVNDDFTHSVFIDDGSSTT
jgi:hypothetical protein